MKRIISIILILISVLPLASCMKENDGKPCVIGTVFPQYDIARVIGGGEIRCEMLLPPGADSHSYTGDDPTDIYRISKCDLFIYVGGETDSAWVERIKDKLKDEDRKPVFLALCDVCETVGEEDEGIIEGEEEEEDGAEPGYDEHVWTSPKCGEAIASAITEELCKISPENSGLFRERCEDYRAKLEELDGKFRTLARDASVKTLVFADRFPFRYFALEYGFTCFAAFNGCATQSEPAPTTVIKLCRIVDELKIPYIFYIETSISGVPDLICKNTGCGKLLLHSCHTVTQSELDGGVSYLSLMEQNYKNLEKALKNG